MSGYPSVVAIVVDWNGAERTRSCVRSLERTRYPDLAIVVVDNGSDDPEPVRQLASLPKVRVLRSERNLGFSGGSNLGIRFARWLAADYVWLINNDAEPEPDALATMIAAAEDDPRAGAVGSLLREQERGHAIEVFGGGSVSFWSGLPRHHVRAEPPDRVDYLRGASILVRCAALESIGSLDEGFFLYWEDTDLSFRLRAAGWRLAVADQAIVRHEGHGSLAFRSPQWDYHFTASSVLFFRRHARLPLWPISVSAGGRILNRILHGRWRNARAVWRGFKSGNARHVASASERKLAPS